MYQSSPRKNFSDALLDPTAIALLGSIALHAILGAGLPFFTQPEKTGKKADPGTVKVVQLTPSELQRIPQAPPISTPQPLPPVTLPTTPTTKVVPQPITPNSSTIPFSPIRVPLEKINVPQSKGSKDQKAVPQAQPTAPTFDPNISFKPTKPSIKIDVPTKPKPAPKPAPTSIITPTPIAKTKKKILVTPDPSTAALLDDDGGDVSPTPAATPNRQATEPVNKPAIPLTSTAPNSTPSAQSPTQSSDNGGDNKSSFIYGKYAAAASERIREYLTAYPDIHLYKPQLLSQSYPVGAPCSREKQSPFIVLMVAFDKVPENPENNPLGDSTAPAIDKPYVASDRDTPENRKLGELAINTALYEANKADKDRPATEKGKRVLYQYRVQFDPTTCKK